MLGIGIVDDSVREFCSTHVVNDVDSLVSTALDRQHAAG